MAWQAILVLLAVTAVVALPSVDPLAAPPAGQEWPVPAVEPTGRSWTVSTSAPTPEAAAAFQQGVAMMDDVRGDLRIVDGRADIMVRWVAELRDGARLGQHVLGTPRVDVALGDSRCGPWVPYDEATLRRVVAHEIGHAIGLGHADGTIMDDDLPATYAAPCTLKQGEARLLPYQTLSISVHTGSPAHIVFSVDSDSSVDACLTLPGTGMEGWGCDRGRTLSSEALLPPGQYRLAIRCVGVPTCDLSYGLGTRPAD